MKSPILARSMHPPRSMHPRIAAVIGAALILGVSWAEAASSSGRVRPATLEDNYDAEAGNSFQGAIGFIVFEGTTGNDPLETYGLALDDMTVEWKESHPIEQTSTAGCGTRTCNAGPRAGKLCFNNDDCGGANTCSGLNAAGSSCAAVTWGTTNLFAGSGVVSLNVVDFNASETQGTFDCTLYGLPGVNNDCDTDGLKEVQIQVKTPAEPNPELIRLEQTSSGSSSYSGLVSISSAINAANDGVAFIQYNGTLTPQVTALYFDRDAGAGDLNGDGVLDSPPSAGLDGCEGYCGGDDDQDAVGPDKRVGAANTNDDGNGICDYKASNVGAQCTVNSNCPGGNCLNIDEADELCGRVCTAGTTSGHCSGTGAVCDVVGGAPCPGTCIADNCISSASCGTGGNCPGTCTNSSNSGAACTSSSTCPGGYCAGTQRGDDNCALIDETNELCAVVAGKLAANIDDNCGCAQNPVQASLNAVFDVADIIIEQYTFIDTAPNGTGDNDGFPDDNELISLSLTLRNLSSFDVEAVEARVTTQDSTIQCINDPAAKYGRINTLQSVANGADLIKFTVGNVARAALTDIEQATFTVTVTGTAILDDGSRVPIEGTATPQRFTVDLDLDVNGGAPAAAKTTRSFQFENSAGAGNYTSDAAWNLDWAHTFFENQSGLHCQYNNPGIPGARSAPVGCFLRQDPGTAANDDWHLHSTVHAGGVPDGGRDSGKPGTCVGGAVPGGSCQNNGDCFGKCSGGKTPGEVCRNLPSDCRGGCSVNPNILCSSTPECTVQGVGKCTNPVPGTCTAPAPGTCAGAGSACMHMGIHAGSVQGDTTRLNNMFYAYYKPAIQVGLGRPGTDDRPVLDFWQQVAEGGHRLFSNLSPPFTLGGGTIHAFVDRDSDGTLEPGPPTDPTKDGWWEKLVPFYGVPAHQRFPAGNCGYDPNDDGNNSFDVFESGSPTFLFNTSGTILGPSSTCYPEFIWSCVGDTQDPPYDPNLGQAEPSEDCFTEVNTSGLPVVREGAGPGRWVETKIDLYRFRGRQLWIRFLTTDVQFGFDTWTTGFGGAFGGNRDDGWYIDDLNIFGTNAASFALRADTDAPPASGCPATNCSTVTPRLSGSTYVTRNDNVDNDGDSTTDEDNEGKFTTVNSDAPLRNVDLNGADNCSPISGTCLGATTSDCLNGVLQYRFWEDVDNDSILDPGELIRDYTENPRATANNLKSSTIHMNVKCSAPAPNSCNGAAEATLAVTVAGRVGGLFNSLVFDSNDLAEGTVPNKNLLEWGRITPTARYDVATKQGISVNAAPAATWLGVAGYFDTMVCGGATPGGGNNLVCTDSDGDDLCEFAITNDGTPAPNTLDIWIVRETIGGSWNEIGGASLGGTTRDTRIADDGTVVCSNVTFGAP